MISETGNSETQIKTYTDETLEDFIRRINELEFGEIMNVTTEINDA